MLNNLILLIDGIYIILALLQYLVAPKVGPNPYFGFRIGYTFSNEDVWRDANKFIGKLMLLHALLLIPFIFTDFIIYFLILFIIPLIGILPAGIKYASNSLEIRGAKSEGVERKIEKITVGKFLILSPAFIYLLLILIEIFSYPYLPPTIAVHFNEAGKPNGLENKYEFIIYFSLLSSIYPFLSYIYIYLGKRYPIYMHPGRLRFKRNAILKASIIAMNLVGIFLIYIYISIVLYALYKFPVNIYLLICLIVIVVAIPIAWLLTKGRR